MNNLRSTIRNVALLVCAFTVCARTGAQEMYIAESQQSPIHRYLILDSATDSLRVSPFLSSLQAPEEDFNVTVETVENFAAGYNAENGTSFRDLPSKCLALSSSSTVLKAGSVKADPVYATVRSKKSLKAGQTYIAAFRIKCVNCGVREALAVYILKAVPAPGNVGKTLLGTVGKDLDGLFLDNCSQLFARTADGGLVSWDLGGRKLGNQKVWTVPSEMSGMDLIVPVGEDAVVGLITSVSDGQLWKFPLDRTNASVGAVSKVFGTSGYKIFDRIYVRDYDLYCHKPDGELMIYPLTEDFEWSSKGVRSMGRWRFEHIFAFGDSLLAVNSNGDLWSWPLNDRGEAGLPRKVGTGWQGLSFIGALQGALAVVDSEGNVWKVPFSDESYIVFK